MGGFERGAEEVRYEGSLIRVALASFTAPDGSIFSRDVVHHPGAVVVVPVTGAGRVMLVRQYRAAVGAELLELPAGRRDVAGEPPEATAARELAEEVGRTAGQIIPLGTFYNSPGFSDELSWLFMALDLSECPVSAQGIEEEHMEVVEVTLAGAVGMVQSGQIVDAKTIVGLCLASRAIDARAGAGAAG